MIPWLMVWQLLSEKKVLLSELIAERKDRFPTSGELNFTVPDATKCLQMMKDLFAAQARGFASCELGFERLSVASALGNCS